MADPARATSRVHCLRAPALVTESDRAEVDPISDAPGNLVTGPETLVDRVRREIDLLILADQARLVIGQLISADRAHPAIGRETLAARDGLATSADRVDWETMSKICRVAFAIPTPGRIGVRRTAAT